MRGSILRFRYFLFSNSNTSYSTSVQSNAPKPERQQTSAVKRCSKKNHFNVSGRKFKKSLTPPKASSHTAWIISTLIFRPKSTLFYLSRLIKKSQDLYHILFPISSWPIHSSTVSPWSEVLRLATFFASKWKENHRHTFGDQLQCQIVWLGVNVTTPLCCITLVESIVKTV